MNQQLNRLKPKVMRMDTYPVKENVADIVTCHDPRVFAGSDSPSLSHSGRIRITDVAAIDVGDEVEESEPVVLSMSEPR